MYAPAPVTCVDYVLMNMVNHLYLHLTYNGKVFSWGGCWNLAKGAMVD